MNKQYTTMLRILLLFYLIIPFSLHVLAQQAPPSLFLQEQYETAVVDSIDKLSMRGACQRLIEDYEDLLNVVADNSRSPLGRQLIIRGAYTPEGAFKQLFPGKETFMESILAIEQEKEPGNRSQAVETFLNNLDLYYTKSIQPTISVSNIIVSDVFINDTMKFAFIDYSLALQGNDTRRPSVSLGITQRRAMVNFFQDGSGLWEAQMLGDYEITADMPTPARFRIRKQHETDPVSRFTINPLPEKIKRKKKIRLSWNNGGVIHPVHVYLRRGNKTVKVIRKKFKWNRLSVTIPGNVKPGSGYYFALENPQTGLQVSSQKFKIARSNWWQYPLYGLGAGTALFFLLQEDPELPDLPGPAIPK
jgi:hypothetical protein